MQQTMPLAGGAQFEKKSFPHPCLTFLVAAITQPGSFLPEAPHLVLSLCCHVYVSCSQNPNLVQTHASSPCAHVP